MVLTFLTHPFQQRMFFRPFLPSIHFTKLIIHPFPAAHQLGPGGARPLVRRDSARHARQLRRLRARARQPHLVQGKFFF